VGRKPASKLCYRHKGLPLVLLRFHYAPSTTYQVPGTTHYVLLARLYLRTGRKRKTPRTALLSQDPAVQVSSALACFTSVFGMGTGGTTPLWARGESDVVDFPKGGSWWRDVVVLTYECRKRSRPRTIRTGQLNASPRLHLRPINPVIYRGPYLVDPVGGLILGWASRLDAFSGYPDRTWLPCLCPWRDSRDTRGTSTPVLSY
jgi:hypothetical protein